jgi:hypothetical protein
MAKNIANEDVCADLQTYLQDTIAKYEKQMQQVLSEQSYLISQKTAPTNLVSAIAFLVRYVNSKIIQPYTKTIRRYAELGQGYVQLGQAVASRIGSLTCLTNPAPLIEFGMKLATWSVTAAVGYVRQAVVGGLNSYHISASVAGAAVGMTKAISGLANKFGVNLGSIISAVGTHLDGGMLLSIAGPAVTSVLKIDSNGILANNGGVFTRVFTGDMQNSSVVQSMRFMVDQTIPSATKVDGYLGGNLVFAGIPAASSLGSFTPSVAVDVGSIEGQYNEIDITHMTINNLDGFETPMMGVYPVGPNFGAVSFGGLTY